MLKLKIIKETQTKAYECVWNPVIMKNTDQLLLFKTPSSSARFKKPNCPFIQINLGPTSKHRNTLEPMGEAAREEEASTAQHSTADFHNFAHHWQTLKTKERVKACDCFRLLPWMQQPLILLILYFCMAIKYTPCFTHNPVD